MLGYSRKDNKINRKSSKGNAITYLNIIIIDIIILSYRLIINLFFI